MEAVVQGRGVSAGLKGRGLTSCRTGAGRYSGWVIALAALAFALAGALAPETASAEFASAEPTYSVDDYGREQVVGADALLLRFPDGGTARFSPGARFTFHADERVWFDGNARLDAYAMSLHEGEVLVKAGASRARAFVVRGSVGLRAALVSGELRFDSRGREDRVSSADGQVWVSHGNLRWLEMPVGQIGIFAGLDAGLAWVREPSAPVLLPTKSLWLNLEARPLRVDVRWGAVPGADAYRLIVRDESGAETALSGTTTDLSRALEVRGGVYRVAVQAVARGNIFGPVSSERLIHVVSLKGRRAQVIGEQNIRLLRGRRVEFAGVRGLLMSIGASGEWVPAVASATLRDRATMAVLFQHPQTSEQVELDLAAPSLRAAVRISPKGATWPGPPLDVEVDYQPPPGASKTPRVEVLVGVKRRALSVSPRGARWFARLPPEKGEGPWVVRVHLLDGQGRVLARDFAEIAPLSED